MATEKTRFEYEKLAIHFYKRLEHKSLPVTAKNIADELLACAPEYRPGFWRRLRCALVYHQSVLGYGDAAKRIQGLLNPVTAKGGMPVKPKQARIKSINQADEDTLIEYFNQRSNHSMVAAIKIFKLSGIRPAELAGVTVDSNRLIVVGAKKSHGGQRGADRTLQMDGIEPVMLKYLIGLAQRANIGVMQDKLRAAGQKLWPRRKSLPTFYSWRHQLGSELKASGLDRQRIAYVMGHQATASVDRYGNKRTARGGRLPSCPADADLSGIRITHGQLSASNGPVRNRGMAAFIRRDRNESSKNDMSQ